MDKKIGKPKASATNIFSLRFINTDSVIQQFANAVHRDMGINVAPIADGEIHRVNDPKGRRHNANCWYLLHLDNGPAGAYGNWRTGTQFTWCAYQKEARSPGDRLQLDAALQRTRQQRHTQRQFAQEQAKLKAKAMWESALPATVYHPYLAQKSVPALNVRELGGWLLVTLYDTSGELVNIQRIDLNGNKRFLKDGRITGCFGLVGAPALPQSGRLYIAEGWATAATIQGQTRSPVAAAMNCGNLKPVALALQGAFPDLELIVAADNDHRTPGNPGITKATEAAQIVGGGVVWPQRCGDDCACTDFNDVANCRRANQ